VETSKACYSAAFLRTDLGVFFWKDVGETEGNSSGFYSEWATTEL